MSIDKYPILFVGHGSPMNAIEDSEFSDEWKKLGQEVPRPKAILAVSAHWSTSGTKVSSQAKPKQIYDMYGFPPELYALKYPAKGDPQLASEALNLLGEKASIDNSWGIDHGVWSVLHRMYPEADVPVTELSVNLDATPEEHFRLGQKLAPLRKEGILILTSGNIVHNLSLIDWDKKGGFSWANAFDAWIEKTITEKNFALVSHYEKAGESAKKAFFTPEHFYPLLYALGAANSEDEVTVFNNKRIMGSLSMTGYLFK
jgi:4,5-DOPA dioxygenase extradiol